MHFEIEDDARLGRRRGFSRPAYRHYDSNVTNARELLHYSLAKTNPIIISRNPRSLRFSSREYEIREVEEAGIINEETNRAIF